MFGLFKSPTITDPTLGTLERTKGYWRTSVSVGNSKSVPLAIAGGRTGPDSAALAEACIFETRLSARLSHIEKALFEHYQGFADVVASGEFEPSDEPFPRIATSAGIWPFLTAQFVCIAPLSGVLTTEIGFAVQWDEEHILGVRFRENEFLELCGSTVPV